MPKERFYISEKLEQDQHLILEDQEFHHLARVMRAKEGDHVELVNGLGVLAQASVESIDKKKAQLVVENVQHETPPKIQIILAQAIPRLNRLDFILEKGTELGMAELWLFPGDRSERIKLSEHQSERFQAVTIAAMKQSGRLFLPKIILKEPISKWKKFDFPIYFGDLDPNAPLLINSWNTPERCVAFCVGPEAGFSKEEEKHLRQLQAIGVKLHCNILRTDTASIAGLSLISHFLMK